MPSKLPSRAITSEVGSLQPVTVNIITTTTTTITVAESVTSFFIRATIDTTTTIIVVTMTTTSIVVLALTVPAASVTTALIGCEMSGGRASNRYPGNRRRRTKSGSLWLNLSRPC